jgi:hypothetical protein
VSWKVQRTAWSVRRFASAVNVGGTGAPFFSALTTQYCVRVAPQAGHSS